jgi:hypothetical protein
MSGRRDFLSMPAPENYVAGLGRGATGFTTRSDLGPAREGPSEEQMKEMLAKRAASLGQAAPSAYGVTEKKEKEEEDDEADRFQDPDNEVGLFSSGMNYDKDDDEADRIYQEVDEKMDKRRRARRLVTPFRFLPTNPPVSYLRSIHRVFCHEQIPMSDVGKLASNKNETNTKKTTRRSSYSSPT